MIQVYEKEDVTCVKMDIVLGGKKINTVYAFLVDGMLIDTGPKHSEAELIPFYENHSIDFVALTHSHEDHTGTAPWIQENRGVPIYIHPKGIEICEIGRASCRERVYISVYDVSVSGAWLYSVR